MARDDDDDDDRPRKKRRSDDDEDSFEDDDRPRRKSRRDDDEEDDGRPRRSRSYDDDDDHDDRRVKTIKSKMPGMLMAAGIVAIAWGGLCLLSSCGTSGKSFLDWNQLRQVDRIFGGMIRDFGGPTPGLMLTLALVYMVMVLASVLLVVGGILLLMRKMIGKYLAIGGPVLMCLVGLAGFVIALIVARGSIFATASSLGLPAMVFFTLCVGGFLIFALLQKDVVKALK